MKIEQGNGFFDAVGVGGTMQAVLINEKTGEVRRYFGKNIVTNSGNRWYAARGALAASGFQVLGMKIGIGSTAVTSTDTDVQTSFASCFHSLDAGYPLLSDTDTDNTSAASNVVCWRVTYSAAGGPSQVGIREVILCDASAVTGLINHALFAAAFDKTTSDTLKIFINHTFTSI